MTVHIPTIESLSTATPQQEAAAGFAGQIDGLLALLPLGMTPQVELSFPVKDGANPGISYKGYPEYPDLAGNLEVGINDQGQRIIIFGLAGNQKIGRPHFAMTASDTSEVDEAARYDVLQIVIDPTLEEPLILLGVNLDEGKQPVEAAELTGIYARDLKELTKQCLKAATKKLKIKAAASSAGRLSTRNSMDTNA